MNVLLVGRRERQVARCVEAPERLSRVLAQIFLTRQSKMSKRANQRASKAEPIEHDSIHRVFRDCLAHAFVSECSFNSGNVCWREGRCAETSYVACPYPPDVTKMVDVASLFLDVPARLRHGRWVIRDAGVER